MQYEIELTDAEKTVQFGRKLSTAVEAPLVIYLEGDLGAGKTTFSRGLIQGLGFSGNVKSPTYTLVEPYELHNLNVYHFDLYRLADPQELDFIGIEEYFSENNIVIIEWPEKGAGWLAQADLMVNMYHKAEQRSLKIEAKTALGTRVVEKLI
ncbi:tRNA (adenosine(37)-N6)-threonylcarbamoyltransferase complex ATPase subunit type 1 TsaE [Catenovulum sediminis]|uniref:tRNA (adenosine(37)-N6)-threonylcarbamoyltransferase complex ATPase subunit type 1 TsaE n=1 Tax=Catenovulum sediminis TaxID=1740262 RepID=UPI00117C6EF5|nr:tRNA (adenosine(37)-N6)-threonylcarbamoyltransferase complex ATPase subunit type 1 TsaE [Catenovulum sediminis]